MRHDSDPPGSAVRVMEPARLDAERAAREQNLQRIDHELNVMTAAPAPIGDPDALGERLFQLTKLDPELRTQLHIIMGNIQLLRLEHDLGPQAEHRLDAMLAAGSRLLERIQDVNLLSDRDANFAPSRIDTAGQRFSTAPRKSGMDVLVCDDIEMNRDIAAALLQGAGHRVQTAEDGAAAVLMATKADFDVILMDVRMPGVDGLEATRRIRLLRGARGEVPIIALTAKVSVAEVAACRAAGMSGHLAKPFRHDTLAEAVERAAALRPDITHCSVAAVLAGASHALNTGQLRALIAPPTGRAGGSGAARPDDTWIDIVSPWSASQAERRGREAVAENGPAANADIAITLMRERQGKQVHLSDLSRTCAPPENWAQHEYHWLLYVDSAARYPDQFSAECELWRWYRGLWRSVAVPGANFLPDDMYRDGWRYGGSCENATAQVRIIEPVAEASDTTANHRDPWTARQ